MSYRNISKNGELRNVVKKPHKKPNERLLNIFGHNNFRGLKREEQVEEFMTWFVEVKVYVIWLQEIWRTGDETQIYDIRNETHGLKNISRGKGSCDIAIVLSTEAKADWESAGCPIKTFGDRITWLRLHRKDEKGKVLFGALSKDVFKNKDVKLKAKGIQTLQNNLYVRYLR